MVVGDDAEPWPKGSVLAMLELRFKVVSREIEGVLVDYAVVGVAHYARDPNIVTLSLCGEGNRRAEWTVSVSTYRALPTFVFVALDEEPGEERLSSPGAPC